jgi:hypothetical protein
VQRIPGYVPLAGAASSLVAVRSEETGAFARVVERLDWPSPETASTISLPRPSAEVGGLDVAVSPISDHLAVRLHSGQSEEGYQPFALSPRVRHAGGMACVLGTSDLAPMTSSPAESLVATASLEERIWWADPADDERDGDSPSVGGVVEWASLYVHRIGEPSPVRCRLLVGRGAPLEPGVLGDPAVGEARNVRTWVSS